MQKHLPKIVIDVIPHKNQRYNTCGDYFTKKGELHIRLSKMNSNHEFLVLIHELTEWYLTQKKGVRIEDIDEFDIMFEQKRELGEIGYQGEPGDHPKAPYFDEHQFATLIEKITAEKLGVNWQEYDKHVQSL